MWFMKLDKKMLDHSLSAGHLAYQRPQMVLTQGSIDKHSNMVTSDEDSELMHSRVGGKWPKQAASKKFKIK
jgi:hypothetical protein